MNPIDAAVPWKTFDSERRRHARQSLFFYLGLPVLTGFLLGWIGAGQASDWPKAAAVSVWVSVCLLGWMAADLGTRVVARAVRPWGWPLTVVLALGVVASGVVAVPLNYAIGEAFRLVGFPTRGFEALADYSLLRALEGLVAPTLIWTSANHAFIRLTGRPRYGYALGRGREPAGEPPSPSAAPREVPAFMTRLRPGVRGRLVAMRAELHYVRVYTDRGDDLILYRFGDAIAEAGVDGVQVHRSWWVAADALEARCGGERMQLRLSNDLVVPVSRSYAAAARDLLRRARPAND